MRNLTNYHSHTTYCDARTDINEFIAIAVWMGYTSYGVSPHSPIKLPTHCNMRIDRVEDYIAEMNRLKARYAHKIELYTGMEIDYIDDDWCASSVYFQNLPLDYRIAGVHYLMGVNGAFVEVDCSATRFKEVIDSHFGGNIEALIEAYYKAMNRTVQLGGYDFIAHPDKISKNCETLSRGITSSSWYNSLFMNFIQGAATHNRMLEINTKSINTGGWIFPNSNKFKLLKELNIDIVVNSDAHLPRNINIGYNTVNSLLKGAGYTSTKQIKNGAWIDNPL